MTNRFLATSGAVLGGLGVIIGAFGAHALKGRVAPDMLAVFETGVRYQVYHALALFAAAWLAGHGPSREAAWAGRLFILGTVLFSGSLYALALLGERGVPALNPYGGVGIITPIGGVALIAGWIVMAVGAWRL